jgi:hypothetical protein
VSLDDFKAAHAWVEEWKQGEPPPLDLELKGWLRTRPLIVLAMLWRWPPSCIVAATRTLGCPAPNTFGIVTSVVAPDANNPRGTLGVRQHPESDIRAHCDPRDLTLVGFHRGITPAVVRGWVTDIQLDGGWAPWNTPRLPRK